MQYVVDTTICKTNTNNVNKTWAILQETGGKDEPNIVFMRKSKRTSQHGTQNVKTQNMTTQKNYKDEQQMMFLWFLNKELHTRNSFLYPCRID